MPRHASTAPGDSPRAEQRAGRRASCPLIRGCLPPGSRSPGRVAGRSGCPRPRRWRGPRRWIRRRPGGAACRQEDGDPRPPSSRSAARASRSRAGFDERTRLRFSRISIARCAGLVPLLRVCLGPSRHGQCTVPWERSPWTNDPGARDLRPGGSAVACRLTLPAGGCAGRRAAAACRGKRGRMPGWPRLAAGVAWPGRREPNSVLSGGSVLRDPHLAARSCRREQDLTGPPRGLPRLWRKDRERVTVRVPTRR